MPGPLKLPQIPELCERGKIRLAAFWPMIEEQLGKHLFVHGGLEVCPIRCVRLRFELIDFDFFASEKVDVGVLWLGQKDQRLALAASSGCSTDSVHERVAPLWWIELDDPVDVGNVDSSRGQVGRQQDQMVLLCLISIHLSLLELLVNF